MQHFEEEEEGNSSNGFDFLHAEHLFISSSISLILDVNISLSIFLIYGSFILLFKKIFIQKQNYSKIKIITNIFQEKL